MPSDYLESNKFRLLAYDVCCVIYFQILVVDGRVCFVDLSKYILEKIH